MGMQFNGLLVRGDNGLRAPTVQMLQDSDT
jgi:hypothetical protein